MRTRLWAILNNNGEPPRTFMPYMGTFHGICVKLLHLDHLAAGLDSNFVIYDTDDQLALVRRIIREHHLDSKQLKPKSIISAIKAFGVEAEDAMSIVDMFNEVGTAKMLPMPVVTRCLAECYIGQSSVVKCA